MPQFVDRDGAHQGRRQIRPEDDPARLRVEIALHPEEPPGEADLGGRLLENAPETVEGLERRAEPGHERLDLALPVGGGRIERGCEAVERPGLGLGRGRARAGQDRRDAQGAEQGDPGAFSP